MSSVRDDIKRAMTPAWQRAEGQNPEGGLNAKGRASYNRATGGNLKAPSLKAVRASVHSARAWAG